jgi:hypothetical protein
LRNHHVDIGGACHIADNCDCLAAGGGDLARDFFRIRPVNVDDRDGSAALRETDRRRPPMPDPAPVTSPNLPSKRICTPRASTYAHRSASKLRHTDPQGESLAFFGI